MYQSFALFIVIAITSIIFKKQIYMILQDLNMVQENYKNINIPIGMGLYFIAPLLLGSLFSMFFFHNRYNDLIMTGCIIMGFTGFLDDMNTDTLNKGLKGHIKMLLKFKLTTGMLKAITGVFISFYISLSFSDSIWLLLLNTFLIALFTNFMNLWDLRPGRASKMFLLLCLLLFFFLPFSGKLYIGIMFFAVLYYLKGDLKAEYMLGDAGSNLLGFFIGSNCAIYINTNAKIIIFIFLVLIHITAEKVSFSKIIKENKLLNYFDMMGR